MQNTPVIIGGAWGPGRSAALRRPAALAALALVLGWTSRAWADAPAASLQVLTAGSA